MDKCLVGAWRRIIDKGMLSMRDVNLNWLNLWWQFFTRVIFYYLVNNYKAIKLIHDFRFGDMADGRIVKQ